MAADTTPDQLHQPTAATLSTQGVGQVGGAWLGGVGVDWNTGHVNFDLGGGGGGGENECVDHIKQHYKSLTVAKDIHLKSKIDQARVYCECFLSSQTIKTKR